MSKNVNWYTRKGLKRSHCVAPCGNSQLLGISMCGAALEDPGYWIKDPEGKVPKCQLCLILTEKIGPSKSRVSTTKKKPMKHRDTYLRRFAIFCPFCKSTSVQENVPTVHYEYVMKENMCLTCKKKWTDIFTLTDVEEDDD